MSLLPTIGDVENCVKVMEKENRYSTCDSTQTALVSGAKALLLSSSLLRSISICERFVKIEPPTKTDTVAGTDTVRRKMKLT